MERVILHSDANSFYASVECIGRPDLLDKPVAVCGDPETRHGIVLTKNPIAKAMGVKTGEPIWQAKRKCPGLVVLPTHFDRYARYSKLLRELYAGYTDRVEPYGLDEAWLDISGPGVTMAAGERLADLIRLRVRAQLGITVSVGVSFSKVLAKLGSDMKKPDGTTVLSYENFQERAWPLPVSSLLYVGPSTQKQLERLRIHTIGDLARADESLLLSALGKNGAVLKQFAWGRDEGSVLTQGAREMPRSVSNSVTTPRDIETGEQARGMLFQLAESVCVRLRKDALAAGCVNVALRTCDLRWHSSQAMLRPHTNMTRDVAEAAVRLFEENASLLPLHSIGVGCTQLMPARGAQQLDFFGLSERRARDARLEGAVDALRERFGHYAVRRGIELVDPRFARVDPIKDRDHVIPFHAV